MVLRSCLFILAWMLAISVIQAARGRPVLPDGSGTLVLLSLKRVNVGLEGCGSSSKAMCEYLTMT